MAVLIPVVNSSGYGALFGAANLGADAIGVHPARVTGEMWLTGLEQTDREGTWLNAPNDDIRWGWVKELTILAQAAAGTSIPYVFPDLVTVTRLFNEKLAKYSERIPAKNGKRAQGKITLVREQELFDVIRSPVYPHAITSCKFIDNSTAERKVVEYSCSNVVDPGDEGDVAARVCSMRMGREGAATTDEPTSGVRPGAPTTALAMDARGERLPGIFAKPYQRVGRADRKTMGRNMRILVTNSAGKINWADVVIPGWNPRDYDTDLKIAVAMGYTTIPGSIGDKDFKPGGGTYLEFDMNNGSLVRIGSNWFGKFLDWEKMTWTQREARKDEYILRTLGLFKTICTDAAWAAALPAMVADTKLWGLIPGMFTFPAWTAGETVQIGTRRFKAPYIYEVAGVVDDNGYVYSTFTPAAWTASTNYTVGTQRSNGTGRYEVTARVAADSVSAASGGPTGTVAGIVDGGITWKYVGVLVPTAPTGTVGPSGDGTAIADGARVTWKKHRVFFPGMSPSMYVRNSRRLNGRAEDRFKSVILPGSEMGVAEPIMPVGYPRFDAHWVWGPYANDDGFAEYEGGAGLSNGETARCHMLPLGAIRPDYDECPNLLVVRAASGTWMGLLPFRIELSTIKVAEVGGMIAGLADQLGVYTGDLDYKSQILPMLLEFGVPVTIPKAA